MQTLQRGRRRAARRRKRAVALALLAAEA
eukprot:COSAG06_NODE_36947_length_441_cov_0.760234_2_plen_28_part_01